MSTQQNGTVWADGSLREWRSLAVPLMSDAVVRSVAVFDGIRADLTADGILRLLSGRAHAKRLLNSARALRLPVTYTANEVLEAAALVARTELTSTSSRIAYVRPMALGATLTERAGACSLTIAAFAQQDAARATIRMQISSIRRPRSDSLPPQIKAVANYQLSRLARITARAAGYDDAIFLNWEGRLAEAAGAAVIVEVNGMITTPPPWEGCLPSITIDTIERLAAEVGIPFSRVPVPLSNLFSADGIALVGTLADVIDITTIDDLEVPCGASIAKIRQHYRSALDGSELSHCLQFDEFTV
jgi:branched-chain amino acid aminotransferase